MNIKFKQVYPTELLIEVKPIESEFSTLYLEGDLRISHLFIKQMITKRLLLSFKLSVRILQSETKP